MQGKLADMYTIWSASRAYAYAVSQACDRGGHARTLRKDAAGAILYSAEKATWMAGEAIQALGGVGYTTRTWWDGCGAPPSCTRSAPAPARSGACSSGASCMPRRRDAASHRRFACRPDSSFSQGAACSAPMTRYIVTMPLSGDA